jgi:tRNA(5-methylaminomethyl-2-thiouridine)-methyltransferase-like protein
VSGVPPAMLATKGKMRVKGVVRYQQQAVDAMIHMTRAGEEAVLSLVMEEPVRAVTPGQVAALYAASPSDVGSDGRAVDCIPEAGVDSDLRVGDGDVCLGGFVIPENGTRSSTV